MNRKRTHRISGIRGKKFLLVGLGILGGGESIARFLKQHGAQLTITDLKNRGALTPVLKRLGTKGISLTLGRHVESDFKKNDTVVYNPSVSIESSWVKLAQRNKKHIENDLSLFLALMKDHKDFEYVAVTGTRGKTTTTGWIAHFLRGSVVGGNMPSRGLFNLIDKKGRPFILELSSFQLEFMRKGLPAPRVAVITRMFVDHLNRHGTFKRYIDVKARIFMNQTHADDIVLSADDPHTRDFLRHKQHGRVYFTSLTKLPKAKNGLFLFRKHIYFQKHGRTTKVFLTPDFPEHQLSNLLSALLAAYLYTKSWNGFKERIQTLPMPIFRQQAVYVSKKLTIINDSAGTSPDATVAALKHFSKKQKRNRPLVLIAGGTDKMLEFSDLAKTIVSLVKQKHLYLLEGSATDKLIVCLQTKRYFKKTKPRTFESLDALCNTLFSGKKPRGYVLFSPASASFEKFKNEFDRGHTFNRLVKKYLWKE
ncbi:MAG: UDP-N-acetylmuramoyl-L-alanine--D-glutamate ligase [Patescibacteria group bacterium]